MTGRIVVLISGNGSNLQAIIDACQQGRIHGQVAAVIANREDAYGLTRARDAGIPTHVVLAEDGMTKDDYEQQLSACIDHHQADAVILAGFMRILSAAFVQKYLGKMLNIHPSLLPNYPGLATHSRVLAAGEHEHGASVHFVTKELDGGPIVLQAKVPIFADDDEQELAARVHHQEHQIYPLAIGWLVDGRLSLSMDGQTAMLDHQPLAAAGYAADE